MSMEFDDQPNKDGPEDRIDAVEGDGADVDTGWDMLSQVGDQQRRGGRALSDGVLDGGFGGLEEADRYEDAGVAELTDEREPGGRIDPYLAIVPAWRAVHEQDRALFGNESNEAARSHQQLADAEWELLQSMAPEIDDTGQLASLESELGDGEDSDETPMEVDTDSEVADSLGEAEAPDAGEEPDDDTGNTMLLEPKEANNDEPELNNSQDVAAQLVNLIKFYDKDNRELPKNAGKRLKETPEVPQEDIQGLLGILFSTSLPTEAWESGWEDLRVDFGENHHLSMHIYTYPKDVEVVTPTATTRIDIPKQQGRLGGIVDAALGRAGDYVDAEHEVPEEAYFETSNLLCHHDAQNQRAHSALADANGLRNPGPSEYDHGILRSIGVKDYVNSDRRYQYLVRAEVGIDHHDEEMHTRYVIYETAKNGGGYLIARSDNDFASHRDVRATTYIPAVAEVNSLRDLIWVMLNSSAL
jgi:hypothetical protein